MPESLIRQEYLCSFDAAQVGSVYGDLLEQLATCGGITTWEVGEEGEVFTSWDLGMGDSTAIWFWRTTGDKIDVIDYVEGNGKPLGFYLDALLAKPYKYR
jgi:hypothetical protein